MGYINSFKLVSTSVADGEYTTDATEDFDRGYFALTFFDSAGDPVRPTAGTATVTVTDDGFNYGTVTNGTVDLTLTEYDRPIFGGGITGFKVVLAGVTGAVSFECKLNMYN